MSNYIENNLQKDEKVIVRAKFSYLKAIPWLFYWIFLFLFGWVFYAIFKSISNDVILVPILACILGLIPFFISLLEIKCTELAVTTRRVIGKRGIISIKTTDILINKVDTVKVQATFWGRICNYYSVEIAGSGKGTDQIIMTNGNLLVVKDNLFTGVVNANQIKNLINVAIEKYADKARKAQASDIADALKV